MKQQLINTRSAQIGKKLLSKGAQKNNLKTVFQVQHNY